LDKPNSEAMRFNYRLSAIRRKRVSKNDDEKDVVRAKSLMSGTMEEFSLPIPSANGTPSDPFKRELKRSSSCSFMRVSDLDIEELDTSLSSSPSSSSHSSDTPWARPVEEKLSNGEFVFLAENVGLVLDKLTKLGYAICTDESERFTPTRATQRILANKDCRTKETMEGWPIHPWHVPTGDDVLLWTGGVHHKGFGHDWPIVKLRGVVRTTPRTLVDVLLDSSKIKTYNKMSQGREDILILQEGVDTTAEESEFGFPGDVKIMRALNKLRLIPKTIEMFSLWYTIPLEDVPGSYMIVSRSVWENEMGMPTKANGMLRSEMLLGVQLIRPCPEGCELTTISHVYPSGVPEMLAKHMAPITAAGLFRDIQTLFQDKS